MNKKVLLSLFLVLLQTAVFGATNTYTGSTAIGGELLWSTASNWSLGTVPTASDDVVIPSGIAVTLNVTTVAANSIAISGTLNLPFKIDITINSQLIVVTAPNGRINFDHSVIRLPSNVALYLQNATDSLYGSCNNNDEIFVGTVQYAVCVGGGALYLFKEIEDAGGINIVTSGAIGTAQSICSGSTPATLPSTEAATGSGTITYEWQTDATGSYATIAGATGASYAPPALTATTSYRRRTISAFAGYTFYSAYTAPVTIAMNSLTITTQPLSQLHCEGLSVNFTAVASGTGLTYTWQRKKPTDAGFITIPNEGNVSYPSVGKIKIDNVGSAQSPSGTQYQVVITNSSGCSVTSIPATLLVNEITNVTGRTTTNQCYGTNYSYTVSTSTPPAGYVVSYQWKSSVASGIWNNVVDGAHFSGATTATLNIINGTPAESAGYRVYITFHSSGTDCNVSSSSRLRAITFLPQLTAPDVTITQPACNETTGTIEVTVQSPTDSYSFDNGFSYQSSNIKSGLAIGSYNIIVKNSANCVSPVTTVSINSAVKTWNGNISSDWNIASNWTPAGIPDATNCVIIPDVTNDPVVSGIDYTALACSLTVLNGGNLIVNSTNSLKVTDAVTVDSGASLTFENKASLIQINDVPNSGSINYKRQTTVIRNMDYTYWSSPVAGFTLGGVSPFTLGDKFYSFDSSIGNWKQESKASSMVYGKGYIIRGPQTSLYMLPNPPNFYEATFVGVPNNGHYEMAGIIADRAYLLGNPYPSALDADTFLDDNQNVLNGTLHFWTHNTPIAVGTSNAGSGVWAYSGDDYASYNRTGGTATAAAPSSITGGINTNIPSGKIASGQGFFASSKPSLSGSKIVYNNSMRVGVGGIMGNNSQFYKTKDSKSKTASPIEKHRVWLDLINTQGAFKETLIGYLSGATNNYDDRFDGESFNGNSFLDFYSLNQNKNLTIQGRALPFDESDEVLLGYQVAVGGTFTIKIGQTDGLLNNQPIFLEDKLTNRLINLKSGDYTFDTAAGIFNNRFVLKYADRTLGVDEVQANDGIVVLYSNNYKTLIIRNNLLETTLSSVALFNIVGQKIADWDVKDREQTSIQIPIKNLSAEIYIVKIQTDKGEFSKKIIVQE